jgi:ketosteroid isomerase-like protein
MTDRLRSSWPIVAAVAVAVIAVVVLVVALGGDDKSDKDQVVETVQTYARAIVNSDGEKACSLFTEEAQQAVARGSRTCAEVIDRATANIPAEQRDITLKLVEEVELTVRVDGDKATASTPNTRPVTLEKSGGDWLISNPDIGSYPGGQ